MFAGRNIEKRVIAVALEGSQFQVEILLRKLAEAYPHLQFTDADATEVMGELGKNKVALFAEGPANQVDEAEAWCAGFLECAKGLK